MFEAFEAAELNYVKGTHKPGNAVNTVLKPADFDAAFEEITTWENYAPTPLYRLTDLANKIGIADIMYKDESPRFGLQSFKALGGAYAGLRVIQRELTRQLNRDVSVAEIRSGALAEHIGRITLTSATDGNHGRSLAWAHSCLVLHAEFISTNLSLKTAPRLCVIMGQR